MIPLTSLILLTLAAGLGLMALGLFILIFRRRHKQWGATAVIAGFVVQLWWVLVLAVHFLKSVFWGRDT